MSPGLLKTPNVVDLNQVKTAVRENESSAFSLQLRQSCFQLGPRDDFLRTVTLGHDNAFSSWANLSVAIVGRGFRHQEEDDL